MSLSGTDEADTPPARVRSHVGQAQVYGQAYVAPVVVGQVMSENDPDWSVFWSRGPGTTSPPDAAALFTDKNVCEDTDTDRATEVVGFIVFEAGHSVLAGVDHEAALGPDTVRGVDDGAPFSYTFNAPFVGPAPAVAITAQAGMDGGDGSWSYVYDTTATTLLVGVDEDQIGGLERSHTTEQVGYVVFQTPAVYPP